MSNSITGRGLYHDPLYGLIPLNPLMEQAMDLKPVQRLRRIKQLGLLHLRYPGATHTRFAHSVGVYHLSTLVIDELIRKQFTPQYKWDPAVAVPHKIAVQLAALFHDLGHGPMSHLWEDFLKCRTKPEQKKWKHENVSYRLISEGITCKTDDDEEHFNQIPKFIEFVKDRQKALNIFTDEQLQILSPSNIAKIAVGLCPDVGTDFLFLSNIIAVPFDADRLDYLRRDSMFTGVETGRIDIWEIINSLVIADTEGTRRLMVQKPAAQAVETLLTVRDLVYRKVYYDPIHRGNEELMLRAMHELSETHSLEQLWICTDEELLALLKETDFAKSVREKLLYRQPYRALPLVINDSKHLDDKSRRKIPLLRTTEIAKVFKAEIEAAKFLREQHQRVLFSVSKIKLSNPKDYDAKCILDEDLGKVQTLLEALPHLEVIWGVPRKPNGTPERKPVFEELIQKLSEYYVYVPPETLEAALTEAKGYLKTIGTPEAWKRDMLSDTLSKAIENNALDWPQRFESIFSIFLDLIDVENQTRISLLTCLKESIIGFLARNIHSA